MKPSSPIKKRATANNAAREGLNAHRTRRRRRGLFFVADNNRNHAASAGAAHFMAAAWRDVKAARHAADDEPRGRGHPLFGGVPLGRCGVRGRAGQHHEYRQQRADHGLT
jgi:hypothetical protein